MSKVAGEVVGGDTVFVIPVGPKCHSEFVADTIESIIHFAPLSRIILTDDSLRDLGNELSARYPLTSIKARVHGSFGNLYLNLCDGMMEALKKPFRVLVRLDTDALISGSDFEAKAMSCFDADAQLGSLGSFRIGYDCVGVRNKGWAKRRFCLYFLTKTWVRPRSAFFVARLIRKAKQNGYELGDSIMGGAAVYRYEAVVALNEAGLLGRRELARIGTHEDYIFGLCLFSIGFNLGEFGNKLDDLPMGVDWPGLPASPRELMALGKSIIHSTKRFDDMDERAIRMEFRSARLKN